MSMPAQRDYESAVLAAVSEGLHERVAGLGRDPHSLGSPRAVADRMLATVPLAHPWDGQIGPFYDTPSVVRLLGISKQAVADRVRRGTLVAATTRQGRVVYPTWQFAGSRVSPQISRIAAIFRDSAADGWAIASWFTTAAGVLDGKTPLEWLRDEGPEEPVAELAADSARRWAR